MSSKPLSRYEAIGLALNLVDALNNTHAAILAMQNGDAELSTSKAEEMAASVDRALSKIELLIKAGEQS